MFSPLNLGNIVPTLTNIILYVTFKAKSFKKKKEKNYVIYIFTGRSARVAMRNYVTNLTSRLP